MKHMKQMLINYCQNQLGRCNDYYNFNASAENNGLHIWDGYNSIIVPWDDIHRDIKDAFFGLCDDDQFIDFNTLN